MYYVKKLSTIVLPLFVTYRTCVMLECHQKLSFKLWLSYIKSIEDANRQVDPACQAFSSGLPIDSH